MTWAVVRARMMRRARLLLALAGLPATAIASQSTEIRQSGRAFSVRVHVARGDTLRFVNEDEFEFAHQLYVRDPKFSFASEEQEPDQTVEMRLTASGTFEVRCEIHPRMKLVVTVD